MSYLYVGIDVSKDNFEVCVKDRENTTLMDNKRYAHNKLGFQEFDRDLLPFYKNSKGKIKIGLDRVEQAVSKLK